MATIERASAEVILKEHPGLPEKSPESICPTDYFSPGQYWDEDAAYILDNTMIVEFGAHNISEGHLLVYRECGKVACRRQCGIVIDASNKILDAQPFSAPCTGKID